MKQTFRLVNKAKGPGGWPAKTGNKSGTGRCNNPPRR